MKRIQTFIFSALCLSLFLIPGSSGYSQDKNIQKTYHWEYQVNEDVKFAFINYNCNLKIHTWDQPEIKYDMTVDAEMKSEQDAEILDNYISNLEFSNSAGSVEFNNRFWISKTNIMGRKTLDLKGEKTVRYTKFDWKGEIWIPVNCNLNLQSKYSTIEMEDIGGRVNLELYNDKLFAGTVNGNMKIKDRYSTLEFANLKDIEADLYSTDIEAKDIGDLTVRSRYSKFRAGNAGKLDINAYNGKYFFGNTGDIRFVDKYSDLTTGIAGNCELDCYNSAVHLTDAADIDLKSKYGKYEFGEAKNLGISSGYNDSYRISSLKSLNITESKYGNYKVDELASSLFMGVGYSDKFTITKTSAAFRGFKIDGKYIKMGIALDKNLSYRFRADVKYPKFDINEEAMTMRIKIKEGSDLEMEAIKGAEKEGMPEIIVKGYDMEVTFTEL
jgi:hypothetical protein